MNKGNLKRLKVFWLSLGLLAVPLLGLAADELGEDALTLGVGQQVTLSLQNLKQVSVGNPAIAVAKVVPNQNSVLLTALKAGTTDIILWHQDGTKKTRPVWVIKGTVREHAQELATLLGNIENIRIRQVGERILIEGQALRQSDLRRISDLTKHYPNLVNLVEMSPDVQPLLIGEINRRLLEFGFHTVTAKPVGSRIFLTGEVPSELRRAQAMTLTKVIFADVIDSLRIGVTSQPLIRLDLTLLEMNRSHLRHLGIQWQKAIEATSNIHLGTPGSNLGLMTSASAALEILEEKGWGRILTKPQLLCRSGEEAEFLAGGEFPIRLINETTADVQFKQYGIQLKMAPEKTPEGRIALRVLTEISSLDGRNTVENIPALLSRRLRSFVTVESGQTLVLGGLTDENQRKTAFRVPLLADIPGLGEFFKSRHNQGETTEILAVITPSFVETQEQLHGHLADFRSRHEEAEQWFPAQLTD